MSRAVFLLVFRRQPVDAEATQGLRLFRAQVACRLLSLTHVLHMFEDLPLESLDSYAANDISALVSVYVNEELERAFTLPVMSVALSWSRETLGAVVTVLQVSDGHGRLARRDARGSSELRRHLFHELVEQGCMCVVPRQISLHLLDDRGPWQKYGRALVLLANKFEGGSTTPQYYEEKCGLQARRQDVLFRI